MRYLILLTVLVCSCATSPVEKRRSDVLECVLKVKANDSTTMDAFEVCRQLYGVRKVD